MADSRRGLRFAVVFDEDLWAREVGVLARNSRRRTVVETARRALERDGVAWADLARCEPHAMDGTRLGGCVKLRVPVGKPPSEAPFGFVLEPARDEAGRLALRVLAFGERHPARPSERSVYERAHNRRHGAWPTPQR